MLNIFLFSDNDLLIIIKLLSLKVNPYELLGNNAYKSNYFFQFKNKTSLNCHCLLFTYCWLDNKKNLAMITLNSNYVTFIIMHLTPISLLRFPIHETNTLVIVQIYITWPIQCWCQLPEHLYNFITIPILKILSISISSLIY